jgi:hypothetical protein
MDTQNNNAPVPNEQKSWKTAKLTLAAIVIGIIIIAAADMLYGHGKGANVQSPPTTTTTSLTTIQNQQVPSPMNVSGSNGMFNNGSSGNAPPPPPASVGT